MNRLVLDVSFSANLLFGHVTFFPLQAECFPVFAEARSHKEQVIRQSQVKEYIKLTFLLVE